MAEAARILEVPFTTFKRRAEKLNCYIPNQSGKGIKRSKRKISYSKQKYDISFFQTLTPYSAYWLGFIAADGCITIHHGKENKFCFCLKEEDRPTVEKLAELLKFSGKVPTYFHEAKGKKYPCVSLSIYSQELCDIFNSYGIVRKKSYKDNHFLSFIPQEYKKYWCFGYFDGDGSITQSLDVITFLGSKKDLEEVNKIFGFNKNVYPDKKSKRLFNLNLHNMTNKVSFAYEYLAFANEYQTLPRKTKLLTQLIELFEQKQINNKKESVNREVHFCPICGKMITSNAKFCAECSHIAQRKVERPTREQLKKEIRTNSFNSLGRKYNVTDNTVRKWCIRYELPFKKAEIKKYSDKEWELI